MAMVEDQMVVFLVNVLKMRFSLVNQAHRQRPESHLCLDFSLLSSNKPICSFSPQ